MTGMLREFVVKSQPPCPTDPHTGPPLTLPHGRRLIDGHCEWKRHSVTNPRPGGLGRGTDIP